MSTAPVAHDAHDLDLEALGLAAGEHGQAVAPLPGLDLGERDDGQLLGPELRPLDAASWAGGSGQVAAAAERRSCRGGVGCRKAAGGGGAGPHGLPAETGHCIILPLPGPPGGSRRIAGALQAADRRGISQSVEPQVHPPLLPPAWTAARRAALRRPPPPHPRRPATPPRPRGPAPAPPRCGWRWWPSDRARAPPSRRRRPSWPGTRTASVASPAAAGSGRAMGRTTVRRPRPAGGEGHQYRKVGIDPQVRELLRAGHHHGQRLARLASLDAIDRLDADPVPGIGAQSVARLGGDGQDAAPPQQLPQRLDRLARVPERRRGSSSGALRLRRCLRSPGASSMQLAGVGQGELGRPS